MEAEDHHVTLRDVIDGNDHDCAWAANNNVVGYNSWCP